MFVLQNPVSFKCGGPFASSSCQSEFDGPIESALEAKTSIGGLSSSLRRNSSNLSQQLTNLEICQADATQIQIDINCESDAHFFIKIMVPTGEVGVIEFDKSGKQEFNPHQAGCGHGVWMFYVCTAENGLEKVLSEKSMYLDGVGTLTFEVDDDMELRLIEQEFLHFGHCHKRRH